MTENKKIKLLILASDNAGVGSWRSIWPSVEIEKYYNDKFDVEIGHNAVDYNDISYFKQFDIIHFHRQLGPFENIDNFFKELKDAGVILCCDIDDYWSPPVTHPMYQLAMKEKLPEKISKTLRKSDYVTTTTDIFKNHILALNKNVIVMPNGIDIKNPMWKDENTRVSEDDKRVRIGYIAGSSHFHDLKLIEPSIKLLHNDSSLKGKYQIVMCGYDTRGHVTMVDEFNNAQQTRKILPHETIWNKFEEILTDNYNENLISPEYKKWLLRYKNEEYPASIGENLLSENYVRRWTLPLTQYGKHYNYADVVLAPLVDNTFNQSKSELKAIECGFKHKVLIAQDYSIHGKIIKHGENGLLVRKSANEKGWYTQIKHVIENAELREKLAENLYLYVKDRYDLKNLTEKRVEEYYKMIERREITNSKELAEAINK